MREIESLKTQYRVSDFITWQRDGLLVLNPNFQRRSVWKKGAKSYLIDTILRGLPIPLIFLRDLKADLKTFRAKRDVVDGQQRLRTLITYIAPQSLKDFDSDSDAFVISRSHNKELAGKSFEQLSPAMRQKILDYQFSVHSFSSDTDDKEIQQIFARMNSSGYKLNKQELRNAEFFGDFKQASYELATEQLHRWIDWGIFNTDQIARMEEVEMTSELMILVMQGLAGRSSTRIEKYYSDYDEDFPSRDCISERFRDVFDQIDMRFKQEDLRNFFSTKTIFYALFSSIYHLRYGLRESEDVATPLRKNQRQIKPVKPKKLTSLKISQMLKAAQTIKRGKAPVLVLRALRGATGDYGSRKKIMDFLVGA